ncbi:unnamed protein product, partial [marine sediment metagenome]
YNWWFRKRPDLIRKCHTKTSWNPGTYAYILKCYQAAKKNWKKFVRDWLAQDVPVPLVRGHEYATYIINAYLGG